MTPEEYWKNFNLGAELDIAGRFLFNGLQAFHNMSHFKDEGDAFEFFYAVAVGVERLLKIAVILTEHDHNTDQDKFEKGLITHNHQDLVRRLKRSHSLNFSSIHNDFIAVLSRFYKSNRYGRYSLASVAAPACERDELVLFLQKHLKNEIVIDGAFDITRNERRHKRFIGKIISKIVLSIFEIVKKEARRLNIYTYEIANGSKASKIFTFQTFDFENEDILQAEILAYFVSDSACGTNTKLMRNAIKPLPFDPALEGDYIAALRSDRWKLAVLDELEVHYESIQNFKDRRDALEVTQLSDLYVPENIDDNWSQSST